MLFEPIIVPLAHVVSLLEPVHVDNVVFSTFPKPICVFVTSCGLFVSAACVVISVCAASAVLCAVAAAVFALTASSYAAFTAFEDAAFVELSDVTESEAGLQVFVNDCEVLLIFTVNVSPSFETDELLTCELTAVVKSSTDFFVA